MTPADQLAMLQSVQHSMCLQIGGTEGDERPESRQAALIKAVILEEMIGIALTRNDLPAAADLIAQLMQLCSTKKSLQKSERYALHMMAGRLFARLSTYIQVLLHISIYPSSLPPQLQVPSKVVMLSWVSKEQKACICWFGCVLRLPFGLV